VRVSLSTEARGITWAGIQSRLTGMRARAYYAWRAFPGRTTEECAALSGMNLLTLRPRTTELLQMGLVVAAGVRNGNGLYRAEDLGAVRARLLAPRAETQLQIRGIA
jgi:hypothetical protein